MTEGKIEFELKQLYAKMSQIDMATKTIDGWLLRKRLMAFLDIGETSMTALEKSGKLVVSKIGKRKLYSIESVVAMIKSNIVSK